MNKHKKCEQFLLPLLKVFTAIIKNVQVGLLLVHKPFLDPNRLQKTSYMDFMKSKSTE